MPESHVAAFTFSLVSSKLCSDGRGAIEILQDHGITCNG